MIWRNSVGILIVLILLGTFANAAHSRKFVPVFFSFGGEKMVKLADFPDTHYFKTFDENRENEQYFDAGVIYKQIAIFGLSLWVYDVRWCGYINEEIYVPMDTVELRKYARAADVSLPTEPPVPFWDEWGGRLVLAGLILGVGLLIHVVGRRKAPKLEL